MKKTIAQQLGVTEFPFEIKNSRGNLIYYENSYAFWEKWERDDNGNQIYYENSIGEIRDNRPKPQAEPITIEIDGKKYKLIEI